MNIFIAIKIWFNFLLFILFYLLESPQKCYSNALNILGTEDSATNTVTEQLSSELEALALTGPEQRTEPE